MKDIKRYPNLNLDMNYDMPENHVHAILHIDDNHYYVSLKSTIDHGIEFMAFNITEYKALDDYEVDWTELFVVNPAYVSIATFIDSCYEFINYLKALEETHRGIIIQAIEANITELDKYSTKTLDKIYELLGNS